MYPKAIFYLLNGGYSFPGGPVVGELAMELGLLKPGRRHGVGAERPLGWTMMTRI